MKSDRKNRRSSIQFSYVGVKSKAHACGKLSKQYKFRGREVWRATDTHVSVTSWTQNIVSFRMEALLSGREPYLSLQKT